MRLIVNVHDVRAGRLDAINEQWSPRITVDQLRDVLDAIQLRWISIDELLAGLDEEEPNVAVLTFDDGYRGVLEHAAPLLRERGIPGAVFVVTHALGADRPLLHFEELELAYRLSSRRDVISDVADFKRTLRALPDEDRRALHAEALRRLGITSEECLAAAREDDRFAMLSVDDLHALRGDGWTIGSHTRTHRVLSRLSADDLHAEVSGSLEDLRALFDVERVPFAYPYGGASHINEAAADAVERAGYACAFTMIDQPIRRGANPLALHRVDVRDLRSAVAKPPL